MLEGLVEQAIALGHLRGDVDAARFVWRLEGNYLAHHVSQRLMRDPGSDAHALAAFEDLVASSRPGRAPNLGGAGRATEPTREERR